MGCVPSIPHTFSTFHTRGFAAQTRGKKAVIQNVPFSSPSAKAKGVSRLAGGQRRTNEGLSL
jgi:hypothetical protein